MNFKTSAKKTPDVGLLGYHAPEIRRLTGEILRDPATVQVGISAPADTVSHALYPVARHLKTALLLKLLGNTSTRSVLVFTLVTGEDKDMVRAINRIIGSEIEQRILSTFDCGSPAPNRDGRSQ